MKKKYILLVSLACFLGFSLNFYFKPFIPLDASKTIDKLVVIKHKNRLDLMANNKVVKSYEISLGRVPQGHKEFEGDKKTPEGLYIIDDKSTESGYHKNLGISYPNEKDIAHAKTLGKSPGGLIKIHGMRNGFGWVGRFHLLFNWTLGCIAVTNEEMDELYENVKVGTPIEIHP